ncbi:MAG TPA: transposase [Pseudoxanthomonas sp.]|nr:transposase [Pseudoxanthomonas sp.]
MVPENWSDPQSRLLRRGRHSTAGGVYLLTFTTRRRERLFVDFEAARLISKVLADASNWPHARVLAWVLMPDHWHGLVELLDDEPLARCVSRAKAAATRQWNLKRAATTSLWAPSFHDRALRCEESLLDYARYIVRNPVRAGLARRCGDYPFWDALWLP